MYSRVKLEGVHLSGATEEEENLNEADRRDEHWWRPLHHLLPVLHRLEVLDQLSFPEEIYQNIAAMTKNETSIRSPLRLSLPRPLGRRS